MVTPLTMVAHVSICDAQVDTPLRCFKKFPKFWRQNNFLAVSGTYIYLPEDMSQEETYLNNKKPFRKLWALLIISGPL